MILTDGEIQTAKDLGAKAEGKYTISRSIAKAQLKKDLDRLEDALENSFVMAYVEEDAPLEATIDPITLLEIIDEMKQALLEEVT